MAKLLWISRQISVVRVPAMGKPFWKVELGWKLLFSMLSGLFVAIGWVAVLGVGIVAGWWAIPPASTVLCVAGGIFAGTFFVIFGWLLQISYYIDHDHDVV